MPGRPRIALVALVGLLLLGAPAVTSAAPAPRVIGGQPASETAWPFAAAVRTAMGGQFCAGSLIRPQWVLTAGHCRMYDARSLRVVLGAVDLRSSGAVVLGVERQIRHPGYRQPVPGAPRDDLMLLRLASSAAQTPIALASANPATGAALRVAGWGATSYDRASDAIGPSSPILRDADVRLRSATRCRDAFGRAVFVPGQMLCAAAPGRDACAGDSGGPLVGGDPAVPVLVGVVSWGTGCALPRYPGVYASVADNRCWIDATVDPPASPDGIALAESSGALAVSWSWSRPCAEAPAPSAFRLLVQGQVVREVGGGERTAVLEGLADGVPVEVAVAAVNGNGASPPLTATGTPGPALVALDSATWSGLRQATLRVVVPAHVEPLALRVESGRRLRFAARPAQELAADAGERAVDVVVGDLPLRRPVDLRVVADLGGRSTASIPLRLEAPVRPRALRRPVLRGAAVVGGVLRCEAGRWTGTRPFEVARRWMRDGRPLPDATASTLRVRAVDRGSAIACRVEVTGPGGRASATSSAATIR